ncbi:MAG TPA: glycosyltransferase [Thermoanaerobaculia bacterium]|nr:glycosyltransferase [Thermoanaerobaculia bacterium]
MISLLIVNYRSAALTAQAIRSARATTKSELQIVVVDNSCDPEEQAKLVGIAEDLDKLVTHDTNRGYAGGINSGREVCDGDVLVVSNPDVTFSDGALDRLADEIDGDVAAAGPALFWDDAYEWLLPPGDLGTAREKIDTILAGRSLPWFEQRDRRRFLQRVKFWSLTKTTETRMLSGAVMAIRVQDFDTIGGFDERFPLYFEEADFLRRISEYRKRIVYVPSARCRHLFNQSASQVAESAAARYAQSELRYLEKWNGPWAARMLKRLEKPLPAFVAPTSNSRAPILRGDFVIEASPLESFSTAAGRFANRSDDFALPPDVLASIRGSTFHLRSLVRATGEVLATVKISA